MKRSLWIVALAVLLLGYGCRKEESPNPTPPYAGPDTAQHALIMYLVGSNSLSWSLDGNASQARQAVADGALGENDRLVVFHDTYSGAQLYEFVRQGDGIASQVVLKDYGAICSTDTSQIEAIMRDIVKLVPARSYGIVFGTHGSGWLPTELKDMKQRSVVQPSYLQLWNKPEDSQTRNFGPDNSTWIDIPDLARSIASIHFDFILFDACFMSSIEALYDFRSSADYIVASPAEVLSKGFPYEQVVKLIFSDWPNLPAVCHAFVEAYASTTTPSAAVALIRTAGLEPLADALAEIVRTFPNVVDADEVQFYDELQEHVFHDLGHYVAQLVSDSTLAGRFRTALSGTVLVNEHTSQVYSKLYTWGGTWIPLEHSCGVNCYIPQSSLYPQFYAAYRRTAWAQRVWGDLDISF